MRDHLVGLSGNKAVEDLSFSLGQRLQSRLGAKKFLVSANTFLIADKSKADDFQKPILPERLLKEVDRTRFHGFDGQRDVGMAGHDNDWNIQSPSMETPNEFQAIDPRHPHICNDAALTGILDFIKKDLG